MKTEKELKKIVEKKYDEIARQAEKSSCGCGPDACRTIYTDIGEDYSKVKGHIDEADLGLGCGIPTGFAAIKAGNTVLDLGSGAGNDCFIAREIVGEQGKIIGLDMTNSMIEKAKLNAEKLGYKNVEFILGDIDNMSISDNTINVVISNCVLNLVPNKEKAFSEIYRVLKLQGHFCISDIVINGELPDGLKVDAEMYAGCVSGALQKNEYIAIIQKTGFKNIAIKKERKIDLPDDLLKKYLSNSELEKSRQQKVGIFSITVFGEKQ